MIVGKVTKRKSAKGKERKSKRNEEKEIAQQNWCLIDQANKVEDPLSVLESFQSYNRNGLKASISFHIAENMPKSTLQWAFDLTKQNMENLYIDSGWGWKDREKLNEMKDTNSRFLVAQDELARPIAFINFRFDIDYGVPVVYCYEIQIESSSRRKGLGIFLMQILQLIAIQNKLTKVVATVLKNNLQSQRFFMTKLRYVEDDTSPDDEYYIIVSKPTKIKK